jgi:transcriptional regulator with XRE-family HTH domain
MTRIDPENEAAVQWLIAGMERQGISQKAMAEHLGLSQPRISELKSGERKFTLFEIRKAAELLDDPPPILGGGERIKLAGTVKAGSYTLPEEEDAWLDEWITLPTSTAYANVPKFAVRVEGTSMDEKYPEGTILICAKLVDLREDEAKGRRYIVRRIRVDGAIETTVKELAPDSAGNLWLWPRSKDPQWQAPISLDGKEGETVEIWARVLWAITPD